MEEVVQCVLVDNQPHYTEVVLHLNFPQPLSLILATSQLQS